MIRPSVILSAVAKDLFSEAGTYAAAAAIVAVAGFLSMKVEDRFAARLEARKVASPEVGNQEEDEDPYAAELAFDEERPGGPTAFIPVTEH